MTKKSKKDNQKKGNIKAFLFYVLAFLIPTIIILTHILSMEIMKGNYIRHGQNFLMADMASQYNSIYAYIWDVLRGNDSIFYSFGKSLGGNMFSTVAYYAASPLNFMYLFCAKIDVPMMTFIILLVKLGLSSAFMLVFLNKKFENNKVNIIFAITYSLMAYTVNYYFNNMWMDVIALTPLVLLGIDKLFKEKSILLYTVTLSISIVANFYISYMLCIFCVLYFIYQLLTNYRIKEFKKCIGIIGRFVLASLLAGGISMAFLLPSILNLSEIMRFSVDKNALIINYKYWHSEIFTKILCKFYIGCHNTSSVLSRVRPNLYCGMLTIVLDFLYFCNKNFKIKEKIFSGLLILFFMLSMMIPQLNLFWQGGSFPNGYICRYSYLFSFFLIYLAARCFLNLDKTKIRYFIVFIILYGLLSTKIAVQYLEFMELSDVIISCVFVAIYLTILILMMYLKKDRKKLLSIILFIIVVIELFINFKLCFISNDDIHMFDGYRDYYQNGCARFKNYDSDTNFYRIDGSYHYSLLDSWICNTHSITTSLSTNTGDLYRFWKENGGSVTYTTIMYDLNKVPIFDAIFGVKYVKSYTPLEDTYYKEFDKIPVEMYNSVQKKNVKTYRYVYENPYALSLGYTIPNNYKEIFKKEKVKDSIDSMNRLMKTLSGNDEDILTKYDKQFLKRGKYKFNINNSKKYFYMSFDYNTSINWAIYDTIYINDKYVYSSNSEDVGNIKIKNKYANSIIDVRVGEKEYPNNRDILTVYYFNEDVFKKDIALMKRNQLTNIVIDGNKMTGEIDASEDSVLFTSIPYEKGWRVYVDGKKVGYEKVAHEFVGIRLKKGHHNIKMVYYPHHIEVGGIITIISLATLISYEIIIRRKKTKKK